MEKKALWFFMIALLLLNGGLLWQRKGLDVRLENLAKSSVEARLEKAYVDEQETLVLGAGVAGSDLLPPVLRAVTDGGGYQFLLLASLDDCTNCIEDEVEKLNQLVRCGSPRIDDVRGVVLDEHRRDQAEVLLSHLSPSPRFPLSIESQSRQGLVGATTPLVLVVRSRDGKIIDAHKPIPQDLSKRDTFYTRWIDTLAECGAAA